MLLFAEMPVSTLEGVLALATASLASWNVYLQVRSRARSEDKTTETHRTDLQAAAVTEMYGEWRSIVAILKAEKADIAAMYVHKCEEIVEERARSGELEHKLSEAQCRISELEQKPQRQENPK